MTKLLLLDCDNTIRRSKSGATFINDPFDQEIISEAADAIARYHSQGWICTGITNQGGVAAGHKSMEAAIAEQQYTLELLPQLDSICFCPDYDGKECYYLNRYERVVAVHITWHKYNYLIGKYRKPNPGMLKLVMLHEGWNQQIDDVLYVGDRPEDEQAAANAGVRFMWHTDFYKIGINE